MRVLIIAAHPDDEVYGVGGTMARLAEAGHEIAVLVVTDGSSTQYPGDTERATRKLQECETANRLLGVHRIMFGGLPDMRLDTVAHVRVNEVVTQVIQDIGPEWVFTHHWGDVNLDHHAVFAATMVACRPYPGQTVRRVYTYEVGSSTEWAPPRAEDAFMPNTYVDISCTIEKKLSAVEAYATELREYPHPRCKEAAQAYARYRGINVGVAYAEAFMLLRELL